MFIEQFLGLLIYRSSDIFRPLVGTDFKVSGCQQSMTLSPINSLNDLNVPTIACDSTIRDSFFSALIAFIKICCMLKDHKIWIHGSPVAGWMTSLQ